MDIEPGDILLFKGEDGISQLIAWLHKSPGDIAASKVIWLAEESG